MSDILTTKLQTPKLRNNLVLRPRLTNQLLSGMDRKLTLISAPAGYGKSTMLSVWILRSKHSVTWVSLDIADNDLARFWAYFIGALQTLNAEIGKNALILLQSPQPPPIEAFLDILLNEIAGFPDSIAHVLDDYQVIQTQSIHASLQYFLEHMPPHMHLVIASRIDPPLPLGRLRARDQLNEIRSADLRFTPDETADFLNRTMGLNLSTEDVFSLEAYTEGWIAGLQLAGLVLQRYDPQPDARIVTQFIQTFADSNRYIISFLMEEVLNQQSPNYLDFLIKTSILDQLSGSLCDYILREPSSGKSNTAGSNDSFINSNTDSQIILEELEHSNLFVIPLDVTGKWFRYHHLFAEVMRIHLHKSHPGKSRELHLRASEWYEQSSLIPEAIKHALDAKEWERAARLLTLIRPENPNGDYMQKAHLLQQRLRSTALADGRMGSLIEISALRAIAFQALGNRDQTWKFDEQAITFASSEGYIQIYVDEGEPLRELVQTIHGETDGLANEYAVKLLSTFPSTQSNKRLPLTAHSSVSTESLSERELAVLNLIEDGASNREIAQTLIITLSTVKRHTGNIYRKLDVSSRTQAVARAKYLNLLS